MKTKTTLLLSLVLLCLILPFRSFSSINNVYQNPVNTCLTPTNISLTNITQNSVDVSWDTVATAIWYRIKYKKTTQSNWFNATTTSTSKVLHNLSDNEEYEYKMQTYCGAGSYSDWSTVDTFTTLAYPPPPQCEYPSNITVDNITANSAIVSWDSVSTALWYYVQYKKTTQNNWATVSTSGISRQLYSLSNNEDYIYQVRSYCGSGNYGDWSPVDTFTTLLLPPPPACDFPSNIIVDNITEHTATISWDSVTTAIWYRVSYKKTTQNNWFNTTTTSTNRILHNLSDNQEYEYKVSTYCGSGNWGDWSPVDTFITLAPPPPALCSVPMNINITDITYNSVLVSWDTVATAIWYRVKYKKTSQNNWYNATTTATSRTLHNLINNQDYEYKIQTYCGAGNYSDWSPVDTFNTLAIPPPPVCSTPLNIIVTDITTNSALVSWDTVATAIWYRVKYKKTTQNNWYNATTTSTSRILHNLADNQDYEYKVQTYCGAGNYSDWSLIDTFITLAPPPPPLCEIPDNIIVSNITSESAHISWDTVTTAIWYRIKYKKTTQSNWYNATTISTSRVLHNLLDNQDYEYKVQTYCGSGNYGDWSPVDTFTTLTISPPPACEIPLNINVYNITQSTAIISWDSVSTALWYYIKYKKVSQNNWVTVSTSNTSRQLFGLNPDMSYEYKIQTYCGSGNYGDWSPVDTFTTLAVLPPPPCETPLNISVTNISQNSATISWDSVSTSLWYFVKYKTISQNNWGTVSSSNTWRQLYGLAPEVEYEYQVQTYCGSGNYSDWSTIDTFTTLAILPPPVCNYPSNISITDTSSNTATICWDPIPNITWYKINYKKASQSNWSNSTTNDTCKILSNLASNEEYVYRIMTKCGPQSYSDWSPVDTFLTQIATKDHNVDYLLKDDISLFPNPNSGKFYINSNTAIVVSIRVLNLQGIQVYSSTQMADYEFDLTHLSQGMYMIQIIDKNKIVHIEKIIITN